MAPPNPKRPPRPPRPPGAQASKDSDIELPFDDDEVSPLQADDPRPQRVPQYPAGQKRSGGKGAGKAKSDRALESRFDLSQEYSDPGHPPVFVYVERGPGAGQLVPVRQGVLVMGRSSSSDLRLQHPSISRRHAQLCRRGDRIFLKDLGSQNGTFINRERIQGELELTPGDEISLGHAVLRLRSNANGSTPSGAHPTATLPEPPRRARMGNLGIAVIAAVVGSAVAALIAVVAMQFTSKHDDEGRPNRPAPRTLTTVPRPVENDPPSPGTTTQSASAAEPGATAEPSDTATAEPSPAEPTRGTAARGPESRGPSAMDVARGTVAATPHRAPPVERPEPRATEALPASRSTSTGGKPRTVSTSGAGAEEVMARYEAGDVAAARELAKASKLTALHGQLLRFESAQAEARRAQAKGDLTLAVASLTTAVELDQALSHGWSKLGPPLRQQLVTLSTKLGVEQAKAGKTDAARAAFETALRYDSNNRLAREGLRRLGPNP